MSRFEQVLDEAAEKVALMKEVRSLTPKQIRRATEILRLLKAGRHVISHAPNHAAWCPVSNGCCECGLENV